MFLMNALPEQSSDPMASDIAADAPVDLLVVDDDEDFRSELSLGLETLDLPVLTAASGAEALALLRENDRIAVVLTDIRMAGMDGWTLIAQARAMLGPERAPEFLVMSGNIEIVSAPEDAVGSVEILNKPFGLRAATDAVRRAVRRAGLRRDRDAGV